jgi:hypothetical protein
MLFREAVFLNGILTIQKSGTVKVTVKFQDSLLLRKNSPDSYFHPTGSSTLGARNHSD